MMIVKQQMGYGKIINQANVMKNILFACSQYIYNIEVQYLYGHFLLPPGFSRNAGPIAFHAS